MVLMFCSEIKKKYLKIWRRNNCIPDNQKGVLILFWPFILCFFNSDIKRKALILNYYYSLCDMVGDGYHPSFQGNALQRNKITPALCQFIYCTLFNLIVVANIFE